jgi:uncharacterized Zn-binding protein involved in type VI secretion
MPGISRNGDVHACGAVAVTYSPNVFADGLEIHRQGDVDQHGPCIGVQVAHSPTTYANGIPVGRCGDNHSGDICHPPNPHVTCSPTTFADG